MTLQVTRGLGPLLLVGMALIIASTYGAASLQYHKEHELEQHLKDLNKQYPSLTKLYSIGRSVQGRPLYVLAIGKHASRPAPLVPNVKYVANMHGNEVVGREMLLHLASHYLTMYNANTTIRNFLDTTTVHLLPCLNPDGFNASLPNDCEGIVGRNNSNNYDLNRNFPDIYFQTPPPIQPETAAVMGWSKSVHFVLSANLHGGAMVVNYPFDAYPGDLTESRYSASPDDDVFRHLSLVFSRSHAIMHKGRDCYDHFENGITNGAHWYPVLGGMQDYMYRKASGYEVLIEMSCCKYPRPMELQKHWRYNRDALLNYLFSVHMGVKGLIYGASPDNSSSVILPGASVVVLGREGVPFHSTLLGEYYKLLLPGEYILKVSHPKYHQQSLAFTVEPNRVTRVDITLSSLTVVEAKTSAEVTTNADTEWSPSTSFTRLESLNSGVSRGFGDFVCIVIVPVYLISTIF
ncbi:hypothetical protein Btru_004530 [Bulinus truncatus]|nr:hypothetical protein Btru_004530 [Bulinus truncatus]